MSNIAISDQKIHSLADFKSKQAADLMANGQIKYDETSELLATFQWIPEIATRLCILDFIRSLVPQTASAAKTQLAHAPNADPIFVRLADAGCGA